MAPLRILISNDDGVFADGIRTLAAAAAARGHQVTVVCPDQERSATGHGLTLQTPIRAERADELFAPGVTAWACSGTPADCMKLALFELVKEKPDLVLSGINHGPNLGTDVFCSGTVAAAMEGTLEGIRSLAVSSACFQWRQFQAAADLALEVSEQAIADQWPDNLLLNLNIPPCAREEMGHCAGPVSRSGATTSNSAVGKTPVAAPTTGWPEKPCRIWNQPEKAQGIGPVMWHRSTPIPPHSHRSSPTCSGGAPSADCRSSSSRINWCGKPAAATKGRTTPRSGGRTAPGCC